MPKPEDLIDEAERLGEDERHDEALDLLARVLRQQTLGTVTRIQALMCRASIYDDLDDHERALADCNAALALDPASPDLFYLRSTIYQSAENWAASKRDLDAAIDLEPQPDLFESRGLARYNLGDYAAARDDFARAIADNEDIEPRFHVYRGMAALLLAQPADAIDDFTNALALDASDVKALAQRAKAYEGVGDIASALADLDRVRTLIPKSELLEAERERLAKRLGKPSSKPTPKPKAKAKAKAKSKSKSKPGARRTSKSRASKRKPR